VNHAKTLRYLLAGGTVGFLLLLFSCKELPTREEAQLAEPPRMLPDAPAILVLVKDGIEQARLEVKGRFRLQAGDKEIPTRNASLGEVVVKAADGGFALGVQQFAADTITITPETPGSVFVDGKAWPGWVRFVRSGAPLKFHVINAVNLEEYLCGVIAGETPWRSWPEEALKAQAIASRTYALHAHLTARRAGRPFDVTADQMSQVFVAGIIDQPTISRAVNFTRGMVLTYQGMIFPAYFHAVCGGHTEDASKVFGGGKTPPLSGVACPYCRQGGSRYDEWSVEIKAEDVTARLRPAVHSKTGKQLGLVRLIEPVDTGVSKREFRLAVGPRELPSTLFTAARAGTGVLRFTGKGFGHGAGMCQYGASRMGQAGWTHFDILAWYYKGARLSLLPYAARNGNTETAPK